MNRKKYGHLGTFSMLILLMIILLTFTSCSDNRSVAVQSSVASSSAIDPSNQDIGTDSFDINVKVSYKVTLDDKIKGINPNIIKATRQAIFDCDCNNAKFVHYNGYTINNDIYIFEVNETDKNTWQVKFWEKPQNSDLYNKDGYCFATVEKQNSGSFKGYIVNPGGPDIREDVTY